MFLLMHVPEAGGFTFSVLAVISRALGSPDLAVGWSYHLFNSAIVGLLFGLAVGRAVDNLLAAMSLGLLASAVSWALANLILMPRLNPELLWLDSLSTPFGMATLIGYAVQGMLLGVLYLWIYNPIKTYDYNSEQQLEEDSVTRVGSQHRA
jgi:hypothetical protein